MGPLGATTQVQHAGILVSELVFLCSMEVVGRDASRTVSLVRRDSCLGSDHKGTVEAGPDLRAITKKCHGSLQQRMPQGHTYGLCVFKADAFCCWSCSVSAAPRKGTSTLQAV